MNRLPIPPLEEALLEGIAGLVDSALLDEKKWHTAIVERHAGLVAADQAGQASSPELEALAYHEAAVLGAIVAEINRRGLK